MTTSNNNDDRLHKVNELLGALVLGEIDAAQIEHLNDLLLADVELRRYATRYFEQETALRHHFGMFSRIASLHAVPESHTTSNPLVGTDRRGSAPLADAGLSELLESSASQHRSNWGRRRLLFAAAAMVLVALTGWIGKESLFPEPADNLVSKGLVATVTDNSHAVWAEASQHSLPNAPVHVGDTLRLSGGLSEIQFNCGATVFLKGPAELEILSGMRATLHRGTLTAQVEETAHGFRVDTPNTKVIDLGTEFGLTVDEQGATDMVVFTGKIAMEYAMAAGDAPERFEELTDEEAEEFALLSIPRESRLLTEGKALHITSDGIVNRIVSITGSEYPLGSGQLGSSDGPISPSERTNVIESVSDNLSDEETSSYYQIVHQGFGEDVRAHVGKCRSEWNGLNSEHGLPKVLQKADYIKTFRDNSVTDHIEITVHLNQAARVFVLFDNRLTLPAWLQDEFEDTGYDIGIDEEPSTNQRWWHKIGHGPGVRLDDACSVWYKDVPAPGSIVLGSLVSPCRQELMYGIAAVPLAIAKAAPLEPFVRHEPKLGLRMIRPDHLPPSLVQSAVEVKDSFDQVTIAIPATNDAAAFSKGMRFFPQTLGGKLNPHRDVTFIDGAMPAMNDGLIARNNDDIERNAWYDGHGRFTLDLGRPVSVQSINCFSWHRTYRNRQYFTVWGSNAEQMPPVDFDHDEDAAGWDYIGLGYSRDRMEYDTVHVTSLQALHGSVGPYRHLLWVSGSPTFFTEIDVHEANAPRN